MPRLYATTISRNARPQAREAAHEPSDVIIANNFYRKQQKRKMFGVRGKVKACNFVHNDEIWKDHVNRELLSQRRWPDKWGFLASEYRQLQLETLRIGQDELDIEEERKQVGIPTAEDSEEKAVTEPQTSSYAASADKMSFPETTSQMIGWKTEILQRKEVERNARGKQDIVKLFKWPREGV